MRNFNAINTFQALVAVVGMLGLFVPDAFVNQNLMFATFVLLAALDAIYRKIDHA